MRGLALLPVIACTLHAAVDFETQIKPILARECASCHKGESELRAWIVPGKPDESKLYNVLALQPGQPHAMPPGKQLPQAERTLIRQWIAEGSKEPGVAALHARIAAQSKPTAESGMQPYKTVIPNTDVSFEMVPIKGGSFRMGTPEDEPGRRKDEGPQRSVTIGPFWMGKYEVAWDEYRLFMFSQLAKEDANRDEVVDAVSRPTRPYVEMSFGMGINGYPAISMTQHAANKYAEWLSAKTGHFYRLPTEAEWEYACRAGTTTAYSFGNDPAMIGDYAWYSKNSTEGKYAQIGTKKPNPWGLYDMHGNVMEWTLDQYDPKGYIGLASDNPWNRATKPYPHAVRGGSWMDGAASLRCGARTASDPSWKQQDPQLPKSIWYHTDAQGLGFRLVRPLKVPTADEMFRYWNSGVHEEP
jgi:formylglycine-generating enzyme required for sulfatase activity